jgi:hypothetical protein
MLLLKLRQHSNINPKDFSLGFFDNTTYGFLLAGGGMIYSAFKG